MSSITIPATIISAAAFVGLQAATAKLTNICDVKTAAVYAAANQATQAVYASLAPTSQNIVTTIGLASVAGYLGGSIATTTLCQRNITVKEVALLTAGSIVLGAVLGGLAGWMMDK